MRWIPRLLVVAATIAALIAVDAGTAMGQEALICRKREKKLGNESEKTVLGNRDDVVNAGDGDDILMAVAVTTSSTAAQGRRRGDRR